MPMDDYEKRALNQFIERTGQDLSVQELEPALNAKIERVEELAMEEMDHEQKVDTAVSMLSSEDLREKRVGQSGEPMDLSILSIGHRGVWEDFGKEDVDTVFAHAIIHGPIGADGQEKAAKAVLMHPKTEMDLLEVQNKFHSLNELQATYEVEEAWELDGFYRCYATDQTNLVETDIEDLPDSRDEKNDLLRRMFPDTTLADLAEGSQGLSAYDPDSGFTHDFGADIKRFRGSVVDWYVPDDRSWGRMTLMDDSVIPEDLEDTRIVDDSGNNNVPGLTVFAEPDYHIQYGNQSVLDVYGVVEVNNDGQIQMSAAGVVPIVPMEMDDGSDSDAVDATETSI
jgi:hypothetical protein